MKFHINHFNINVLDLDRSLAFYTKALGFHEVRRKAAEDGSFIIAFISDDEEKFMLELTWLADRKTPYELGDNESHFAVQVDDFDAAYKLHSEMGCISYENKGMGIYFIHDPDDYWTEIVPMRR